jgi:hypothetical protein
MKNRHTDTDDKVCTAVMEKGGSGDTQPPETKKGRKGRKSRETPEKIQPEIPDTTPSPAGADTRLHTTPDDDRPDQGKTKIQACRECTVDPESAHDEVFMDIIAKAREGNIKYQELYLKYIDLITEKGARDDKVIYEATFIEDKNKKA